MPQNNQLINFLQELIQRFATKSPKFFRVWQLLLSVLTAVTGLPEALQALHITLPGSLSILQNSTVAWASSAALVMSMLTTQSKPTAVKEDGTLLKETDAAKLPFTAANEVKTAAKKDGLPEVSPT